MIRRRCDSVQVDQDTRIAALIRPGERHQRAGGSIPSARDLDLRAGKIELGLVGLHGHVQSDLLDAKQILAAWGAVGDGCVGSGVCV